MFSSLKKRDSSTVAPGRQQGLDQSSCRKACARRNETGKTDYEYIHEQKAGTTYRAKAGSYGSHRRVKVLSVVKPVTRYFTYMALFFLLCFFGTGRSCVLRGANCFRDVVSRIIFSTGYVHESQRRMT